jgi:hypothetical protein
MVKTTAPEVDVILVKKDEGADNTQASGDDKKTAEGEEEKEDSQEVTPEQSEVQQNAFGYSSGVIAQLFFGLFYLLI